MAVSTSDLEIPSILKTGIIQPISNPAILINQHTVDESTDVFECCKTMLRHGLISVIVTRSKEPVGIVKLDDVFDAASKFVEALQQSVSLIEHSDQRAKTIEASLHLEIGNHLTQLVESAHRARSSVDPNRELQKIIDNARSVKELLTTFEIVSRAGSPHEATEYTDLNAFLSQLAVSAQASARSRSVAIAYAPNCHVRVPFSRKIIAQALRGLLEDMIRSHYPGASIRLESFYKPRKQLGDAHIRVVVQGSRSHIATERELSHLLLRECVHQQGGQFYVEAEQDDLLILNLSLPNAEELDVNDHIFEIPTVLIVEDDPDVLHLLADIVGARGYKVLTAVDGEEALKQFDQHNPALVLSDVRMPKLDGIGLAVAIKERSLTTPVILFSGQYPSLAEDRRNQKIKADHVLYKPFATADVIDSLSLFLPH